MTSDYTVYEYYDGYEYEWRHMSRKIRPKVQYVVLGELDAHTLVICYIPSGIVAKLSCVTHKRAWIKTEFQKVTKEYLNEILERDRQTYKVQNFIDRLIYLQQNKENLDQENRVEPGHSISGYDGSYGIHYIVRSGQSFTDVMVREIKMMIQVLQIRDSILNIN